MNSHLIERYRKCHTSEEVLAEQEKIQAEMETEAAERKAKKAIWDQGDLLRANPNHAGGGWDNDEVDNEDQEEEGNGSEDEVDDVEALVSGMEQTAI